MDLSGGIALEDQVYVGLWTNWSRGKLYGSTLTITARDGNFLIAFIALYVAFAGGSLYRILCFFMHLVWSSERQNDTIHHQRQAILRNSESGLTATWALIKMMWQWKRKGTGKHIFRRLLPVMGVIITLTLVLLAAGVYSSEISAMAGDEVLLRGSNCGLLPVANAHNKTFDPELSDLFGKYVNYDTSRVQAYLRYSQDCYSGADSRNCKKILPRTTLKRNMVVDKNWKCPFDPTNNFTLCQLRGENAQKNIRIDSGLLDSHADFGINAPPEERVYFRQIMSCAPLNVSAHTRLYNWNLPQFNQSIRYKMFLLGESRSDLVTYLYSDEHYEKINIENSANSGSYTLGIKSSANSTLHISKFDPIPELARNDSDIMLAFLSQNNVLHLRKTYDPWYWAVQNLSITEKRYGNKLTRYVSSNSTSVMGCALQYQTCLPSLDGKGEKRCSQLGPSEIGQNDIAHRSVEELRRMQWIRRAVMGKYSLPYIIERLGQDSLTSRLGLSTDVQSPLPDDQWKSDVQQWFEISLAGMQMAVVDTVTGPGNDRLSQHLIKPQNPTERSVCDGQKFRSTAHSNFSTLGLIVIFAMGASIVMVHWSLEHVYTRWLWRICRSRGYSSVEWTTNGVLQLQRLAHEGAGSGSWKHCHDNCPVTEGDDGLTTLDISDPGHPRLRSRGGLSSHTTFASFSKEQVVVKGLSR